MKNAAILVAVLVGVVVVYEVALKPQQVTTANPFSGFSFGNFNLGNTISGWFGNQGRTSVPDSGGTYNVGGGTTIGDTTYADGSTDIGLGV